MGRISAGSGSQQVKRRSRLSEPATDFISRGLLDQQPLPHLLYLVRLPFPLSIFPLLFSHPEIDWNDGKIFEMMQGVQKGPSGAKHGRLAYVLKGAKRVQKDPK